MSSSRPLTPFRKAWFKWKALHLPWRKRFLIGLDLEGNTFWEFRDTLSSHKHRMRRIVQYPAPTHLSEVNISPQWHQWLKHVRKDAPSIQEQSLDVVRQRNLKILAAEADARWAAKGSLLERPKGARLPISADVSRGEVAKASNGFMQEAEFAKTEVAESQVQDVTRLRSDERPADQQEEQLPIEDPWKRARGGPSEEWQPKAWDGNLTTGKK